MMQAIPQAILVSWLTWEMNADDLIDNWPFVEGTMPDYQGFLSQSFSTIYAVVHSLRIKSHLF